jgi:S1-C subfamily serine protease
LSNLAGKEKLFHGAELKNTSQTLLGELRIVNGAYRYAERIFVQSQPSQAKWVMVSTCTTLSAKAPPSTRNAPSPPSVGSSGTGFFVSSEGHIVTNAHVVSGCTYLRSSRGGQLGRLAIDEESDLALYIVSAARIRGGKGPRVGEAVLAIGFPLKGLLSSDPIVTTGMISALAGISNDRRKIQIRAPVQPGNSGGPLLGENGSVVGVVVGN